MAYDILQSSTQAALVFLLVQSSDHITGLTGATATVTLSKNGSSFSAASGTIAELGNGWYKVGGNATDTNTLGPLALHATATSGDPCDIVVANIISYNPQSATNLGLSALPTANPGAVGGVFISGATNNGTTTVTSLTISSLSNFTGNVALADGLTITRSTANSSAISATGNGTGSGAVFTSGSGATGDGIQAASAASNGHGVTMTHTGTGKDLNATTTPLVLAKTTNITGFNDITAAAAATGVWQDATANDFTASSSIGKSLYTSGVVPGGTGGLFIAGTNTATTVNFTSNITGNLSGSVGSVTGAVGSVTGNVSGSVASVVGNVGGTVSTSQTISTVIGNVNGSVASVVGAVGSVTGNVSGSVASVVGNVGGTVSTSQVISTVLGNINGSVNSVTTAVAITSNRKKGVQDTFEILMQDSTTGAPKTGLTVAATISKDGGAPGATSNAVTEVGLGQYQIVLTATEMTANNIFLQFTSVGAITASMAVQTQP